MQNALKNYKHDSQRKIVQKSGLISFHGVSIRCFVLNISSGGAGLVLESEAAIPFAFELTIGDERIRRRCLMVWRDNRQMGVVFDSGQPA